MRNGPPFSLRLPARHPALYIPGSSATPTSGVWTSARESARCSSAPRMSREIRSTPRTGARSRFNPAGAEEVRSGLATQTARTVCRSHPATGRSVVSQGRLAGRRIAAHCLSTPVRKGSPRSTRLPRTGASRAASPTAPPTIFCRAGRTTVFGSISPPTAADDLRFGESRETLVSGPGNTLRRLHLSRIARRQVHLLHQVLAARLLPGGSVPDAGAGRRGNADPTGSREDVFWGDLKGRLPPPECKDDPVSRLRYRQDRRHSRAGHCHGGGPMRFARRCVCGVGTNGPEQPGPDAGGGLPVNLVWAW